MQRTGIEKLARGAVAIALAATTMTAVAPPAEAADDLGTMEVATVEALAAAITAANADTGAEVITVAADLTLTSSMPQITGPLTIVGAGPDRAITIDTAGFRLATANGWSWTEPTGTAAEIRLAVKVQNLTLTGATRGGGSMMLLSRMHTTIEDVDFVDNAGGWEGNIYAKEGGTTLLLHRISVSGQTGTLVTNDHGGTPKDSLDENGQPTLTEAQFDNRLYVADSTFASNTGCVIFAHRWTSISDSSFHDSGQVCLNGVSTDRIARTSFIGTELQVGHPWTIYNFGPRYVQLDEVSIRPSLTLSSRDIHVLANQTTVCGQPIESYTWENPTTASTVIGSCTSTGVAPAWSDQELPELALHVAVDDGVAANGDPSPTYSVTSGALPAGLVLDATSGALTGAPTAAGDYTFVLAATNDMGAVTASFSGTIPQAIVPVPAPVGPQTLAVPADGAPGDGDGVLDGTVRMRSSGGVQIALSGVAAASSPRLVLSDLERPEFDRGMTATGVAARIEARDLAFTTAEICLPVDAALVEDRDFDRIRLLRLDGTTEHDITDEVVDDEESLVVCGRTTRLGTFRAVLLAGERFAGSDRYETAAALALAEWSSAGTVFVASAGQHADAVVAGVLAAAHGAPVLLTRSTSLPPSTAHALSTLRPQHIVVVGGPRAVHPDVVTELQAFAPLVEVTAGDDRHETAARAAAGSGENDVVYLVAGDRFADAIAAGSAAASVGAALLSTDQSALPQSTRTSLLQLDPSRVVVAGGSSAISDAVVRSVEELLPAAAVERVGGADRYLTAMQLTADSGHGPIVVATGGDFADLVAAMPFAARRRSSVILVPPTGLTSALRSGLTAREPDHVTVVGGSAAISAATELGLADVQAQSRPGML